MPNVEIIEKGCRGCTLCVDICPVEVFDYDQQKQLASVAREGDCIGCLSCHYVCPSACVEVKEVEMLRPFHRIEHHARLVERFLQAKTATATLQEEDYSEAYADVSARLLALGQAITECMGRGQRAVGRRAGMLAATHLPEMYEESGLKDVLERMKRMFEHSFVFDFAVDGEAIKMTFTPCGLCDVVRTAGQEVGKAVLCHLFHEYWAGLITQYVGTKYQYEVPRAGDVCVMQLTPR